MLTVGVVEIFGRFSPQGSIFCPEYILYNYHGYPPKQRPNQHLFISSIR
jgi:hypothetical protein